MLQARQLECTRGDRRLFHELSFDLDARQALRVAGENGSGKSSLLRMIAGLSPVETGEVLWKGKRIGALGEEYRRDLLFIGHANGTKDDLSSVENLRYALALAGMQVEASALKAALDEQGLGAAAHLPARLLSQGQRRRAALCRLAFAQDKTLWVLDEPFAALDAASVGRVAAVMAAHVARGGVVIFTTHQDADLGDVSVQSIELGAYA
ncbi:MAG: cytochrome c biogenesis heme-transporting ATPase CcmA [Betaproteobacteria bacterium]